VYLLELYILVVLQEWGLQLSQMVTYLFVIEELGSFNKSKA